MPRHLHIKFAPSSVRLYSNDYSLSFALVRGWARGGGGDDGGSGTRCSRRCNIAETVSLRRHAQRGLRNYGLEENKKGNRAEKQNCRVELRVEVESTAATLYSLEIVPWYRKTDKDAEHKVNWSIINLLSAHAHSYDQIMFLRYKFIFYDKSLSFEKIFLKNFLHRNIYIWLHETCKTCILR